MQRVFKQPNIITSNIVIAKFMDYQSEVNYKLNGRGGTYLKFLTPHDVYWVGETRLNFDNDWNWLMAVVEKINKTTKYKLTIEEGRCTISDEMDDTTTVTKYNDKTISAVYSAVIYLIDTILTY